MPSTNTINWYKDASETTSAASSKQETDWLARRSPKWGLLRSALLISTLTVCWYASGFLLPTCRAAENNTNLLRWQWEHDVSGRIIKMADPGGRNIFFNYEAFPGNPDKVKRVTRRCEGSETVYEYDQQDRITTLKDAVGTTSFGYNDSGQMNLVQRQGAYRIAYTHDTLGRITSLRVGDFYQIGYSYDFLGRLSSMKTPAGLVSYDYQTGLGQVIRSLPNGIKTFWKRQPNGELEEITHGFFKQPDAKAYSVLARYTYTHGPDGKISAIRERSGQGEVELRYGYDKMGRLVSATGPGGKINGYAYDLVGNRTNATATGHSDQISTYDWAGRLTSVDGKTCAYDKSGNLTEVTLDGVARQYRYQPDGRLAEARVGGETVKYDYDGNGRLVARKTTAGETRFIPDPLSEYWQPLVMEESDGKRTLVIWDGNTPLAIVRDGQTEWLLHDHLGSVRLVANGYGNVKQQRQYDPFGLPEEVGQGATLAPGFAGLFWDGWAHGYLALARAFLPELGSFLQPDPQKRIPLAVAGDCSLYSYCNGDPLNHSDRDGADARWVWGSENWAWQVVHNPFPVKDIVYWWQEDALDTFLQGSKWGGSKQSGGIINSGYDVLGRHPVGDPRVPGINQADENYRRHDLQDFVNWHAKEGTWWSAATSIPGKYEYYKSNGQDNWWHNIVVIKSTLYSVFYGLPSDRQSSTPPSGVAVGSIDRLRKEFPAVNHSPSATQDLPSPLNFAIKAPRPPERNNLKKLDDGYPPLFHPPGGGGGGFRRDDDWPPGGGGSGSRVSPSPVGGVYLGGAGGAIDGLDTLKGIRLDSNGNLVLVGEDGGDVKLPPLRLDDLVTVFRSVYLNGEGPTVTIDPNPENPEKSAMIIVHSEATKDTYVGWVLYEADRLMKGYTLGVDNITTTNVVSQVPGYQEVVDTIYFGGGDPRASQKQGNWERFWIVPAEANRFEGTRRELTLFDVPLKVKTQKMKWETNKLVDDLTGKSSPGAEGFTSWFTKNYEGIAREQYLLPPPESGLTKPVPVFAELRRVALLTAIAEKLRDQGVPMPFWMRDYEVKPVPFEQTTPAMEVTRSNDRVKAHIFGGVELSPDSKAIKIYSTAAEVAKAPPEKRAEVDRSLKLTDRLEKAVAETLPSVGAVPLTVQRVEDEGRAYQVVSIPGAATRALGSCRLDEADLVVPVSGGRDIRLVRSFNSFFNPKGPWGKGWTLDLPRLEKFRIPGERGGSTVTFSTGYELLTPLNSLYARFNTLRPVPELNNSKLQVPDQDGPFYGLADDQPKFLKNSKTEMLIGKDGARWHFTEHGELVAVEEGPQVTVYERGNRGQVTRIVALLGGAIAAQIVLQYTSDGLLSEAVGSTEVDSKLKPVKVTYDYNSSGKLTGASSSAGSVDYKYQGASVTAVTRRKQGTGTTPEDQTTFEYNAQGQLMAEKNGDTVLRHTFTVTPGGGVEASVAKATGGEIRVAQRYDRQMRPIEATEADGSRTLWTYLPNGGIQATIITANKRKVTMTKTSDGREQTVQMDGNPTIIMQSDAGGHLTTVSTRGSEGNQTFLEQKWHSDGQIAEVIKGPQTATYQYSESGLLSSVIEHPSTEKGRFQSWQETVFNPRGLPVRVTDFSGLDVGLAYDPAGRVISASQKTRNGSVGYKIDRNDAGQILAVNSSWGNTSYAYTPDGDLQRLDGKVGNESTSLELSGGLVRKITSFDKGVTTFDYQENGNAPGQLRGIKCANGLQLAQNYDARRRLESVSLGNERRIRLSYDSSDRVASYAVEPPSASHSVPFEPSPIQTAPTEPVPPLTATEPAQSHQEPTKQEPPKPKSSQPTSSQLPPQPPPSPEPSQPPPSQNWASDLVKLTSTASTADLEASLPGTQFGPYTILEVNKSFTATRALKVKGPDGVSYIKVQPWTETAEKEVRLNLKLLELLDQSGPAVVRPLTVRDDAKILIQNNCIITRETLAPGRHMSEVVLKPSELDIYCKAGFQMFLKIGEVASRFEVKKAIVTEQDMHDKLVERNRKSRLFFNELKAREPEKYQLTDEARSASVSFNDGLESMLDDIFKQGPFDLNGLVHDNHLGNFFIDGEKVTSFDFGGDYIGNLGNVFSEQVRATLGQKASRPTFDDFKACFDLLKRTFSETAGRPLSEKNVNEILRCMIMTPYVHTSSDTKGIVNRLKTEFGIPAGESTDQLLWAELDKPANQGKMEEELQKSEGKYLQNMTQMQMTLQLLLEHTANAEEKASIQKFIRILDDVLRTKVRVVFVTDDRPGISPWT